MKEVKIEQYDVDRVACKFFIDNEEVGLGFIVNIEKITLIRDSCNKFLDEQKSEKSIHDEVVIDRNCDTCIHEMRVCYERPCDKCFNKEDRPNYKPDKDTVEEPIERVLPEEPKKPKKVKYVCSVCKENNIDRICKIKLDDTNGEPNSCIYTGLFVYRDKANWKRSE